MSWYDKSEFEYEFARRTLVNLELIEKIYKEKKELGLSDKEIDSVYEVTQLINSFIGFLVIPRAEFFNYLPDDVSFEMESEAYRVLEKVKVNKHKYSDTYRKCVNKHVGDKDALEYYEEFEELNPKTLSLRLRNAIAHSRIKITPIKGFQDTSIMGFVFEDSSDKLCGKFENGILNKKCKERTRINQEFMINLSVKEIRILVLAICKLMLKQYK